MEAQLEFAGLEHRSQMIFEHRQQHFIAKVGFERLPIDVEEAGKSRLRTPFEHVAPPWIGKITPHMVGNHIEQEPHSMLAKRGNELFELVDRAKFRIELLETANVVAVGASRTRLEKR